MAPRQRAHVRRADTARYMQVALEAPLALVAVGLAGLVLGLSAWLLVLRPSSDPQPVTHATAPAATTNHSQQPNPSASPNHK